MAQDDELFALQSIFGDDYQVTENACNLNSFTIRIKDPNGLSNESLYCPLLVEITLPKLYPGDRHAIPNVKYKYEVQEEGPPLSEKEKHRRLPVRQGMCKDWLSATEQKSTLAMLEKMCLAANGEPVLFDWLDWLSKSIPFPSLPVPDMPTTAMDAKGDGKGSGDGGRGGNRDTIEEKHVTGGHIAEDDHLKDSNGLVVSENEVVVQWRQFEISYGPPLVDRKSTFIAYVAPVTAVLWVKSVLGVLKLSSKIRRCTHLMYAYRIVQRDKEKETSQQGRQTYGATGGGAGKSKGSGGGTGGAAGSIVVIADNDDDGEAGAGGVLAHLLDMTKCENVMVAVARWYGGIQLGPDRFKHIARVARVELEARGFINQSTDKSKKA